MASPVRQAAGAAPTAARDCLMDATPPASARMRAAGGGSPLVLAGDRSGCPSAGCTGEGTAADAELSASPHGAVGAPTLLAPDVTGGTGVIASQAAAPHAHMAPSTIPTTSPRDHAPSGVYLPSSPSPAAPASMLAGLPGARGGGDGRKLPGDACQGSRELPCAGGYQLRASAARVEAGDLAETQRVAKHKFSMWHECRNQCCISRASMSCGLQHCSQRVPHRWMTTNEVIALLGGRDNIELILAFFSRSHALPGKFVVAVPKP